MEQTRTHTLENMKDVSVDVLIDDGDDESDSDYDDELPVIPQNLVKDNPRPITSASILSRKLAEKRRASVAVWSDDKLMKFAQNVTSQAIGKVSRFAQALSIPNLLNIDDTEHELSPVEKTGLFVLDISILVNILRLLDLVSLSKIRGVNKYVLSVVAEKDFQFFSNIDLTPYNKKINDIKLGKLLGFCGSAVQTISLKNCWSMTDGGLANMAKSANRLMSIDLSNCWELTDNGLLKIAETAQLLTRIDLSNCKKITDVGILSLFSNASNLERINLSYCKNLTEKMMNHSTWANIKQANLQRCTGIRDAGFLHWNNLSIGKDGPALGSIPFAMEDLNLADCSFLTDESISVIGAKCPQLKRLSLSFCCSLTEQFAFALSAGCPFLKTLDVSYCGGAITDATVLLLGQGLPSLTSLGLRGCVQLSDTGLGHLATHALVLHTINFTQCKNVSPNVCHKLGIQWNCISTPVYAEDFEAVSTRKKHLSSIN